MYDIHKLTSSEKQNKNKKWGKKWIGINNIVCECKNIANRTTLKITEVHNANGKQAMRVVDQQTLKQTTTHRNKKMRIMFSEQNYKND